MQVKFDFSPGFCGCQMLSIASDIGILMVKSIVQADKTTIAQGILLFIKYSFLAYFCFWVTKKISIIFEYFNKLSATKRFFLMEAHN